MEESTINLIENLMRSDDECRVKQSKYLEKHYEESTGYAKQQIDLCFIALCGYSLETLILKRYLITREVLK